MKNNTIKNRFFNSVNFSMTLFSYGLLNNIQVFFEKDNSSLDISRSCLVISINNDGDVKTTEYIMSDYEYNSFKHYLNSEVTNSFA